MTLGGILESVWYLGSPCWFPLVPFDWRVVSVDLVWYLYVSVLVYSVVLYFLLNLHGICGFGEVSRISVRVSLVFHGALRLSRGISGFALYLYLSMLVSIGVP